jgi:hypothetical protein
LGENFINFGVKMRNSSENNQDTLLQISNRQFLLNNEFENAHNSVRRRLRVAMIQAKKPAYSSKTSKNSSFGSAWLPGPLSYPWLLMLAGIPKIIDQLIRQV